MYQKKNMTQILSRVADCRKWVFLLICFTFQLFIICLADLYERFSRRYKSLSIAHLISHVSSHFGRCGSRWWLIDFARPSCQKSTNASFSHQELRRRSSGWRETTPHVGPGEKMRNIAGGPALSARPRIDGHPHLFA